MAEEITLEQRLKQDAEERYQNAVRNAENVMIRTGKLTEEANAALDATTQELRDLGYDNNQLRQLYQDVSVENVQAKDKTEQFIIDAIDGVFDRRTPAMVAAEDEYRQAQQDVLEHSITHARGNEEQLEGLLQELEPLEVLRDQAEQVLREQHGYGDQEIDWLNAEAEQKVAARMSDLMMETVIELDESELEEMTDDNKLEMFQKAPGMTEDEAREAFIATEIAINDLITSAGDDPEELSNEMFITVTRTIPGDLRRQRMDVIETLRDDYGYQPEDFAALRQEVQQQAVEDEIIIDEQNPLTEDEAREQFITTEIAMADHDPNNIPQDIRDQQREAIQLLRENFNYEPADFDAMREEAQQWIAQQDTPDATTILTATQMEVEVHTAGAMALRDRDTYITIDIPAILGEDRDVFEDRRDQLRDALAMEAVTFLAQPDLRDSKGKSISLAGVEVKVEVDTESSLEDGITMHIALDGGDRKSRNIAAEHFGAQLRGMQERPDRSAATEPDRPLAVRDELQDVVNEMHAAVVAGLPAREAYDGTVAVSDWHVESVKDTASPLNSNMVIALSTQAFEAGELDAMRQDGSWQKSEAKVLAAARHVIDDQFGAHGNLKVDLRNHGKQAKGEQEITLELLVSGDDKNPEQNQRIENAAYAIATTIEGEHHRDRALCVFPVDEVTINNAVLDSINNRVNFMLDEQGRERNFEAAFEPVPGHETIGMIINSNEPENPHKQMPKALQEQARIIVTEAIAEQVITEQKIRARTAEILMQLDDDGRITDIVEEPAKGKTHLRIDIADQTFHDDATPEQVREELAKRWAKVFNDVLQDTDTPDFGTVSVSATSTIDDADTRFIQISFENGHKTDRDRATLLVSEYNKLAGAPEKDEVIATAQTLSGNNPAEADNGRVRGIARVDHMKGAQIPIVLKDAHPEKVVETEELIKRSIVQALRRKTKELTEDELNKAIGDIDLKCDANFQIDDQGNGYTAIYIPASGSANRNIRLLQQLQKDGFDLPDEVLHEAAHRAVDLLPEEQRFSLGDIAKVGRSDIKDGPDGIPRLTISISDVSGYDSWLQMEEKVELTRKYIANNMRGVALDDIKVIKPEKDTNEKLKFEIQMDPHQAISELKQLNGMIKEDHKRYKKIADTPVKYAENHTQGAINYRKDITNQVKETISDKNVWVAGAGVGAAVVLGNIATFSLLATTPIVVGAAVAMAATVSYAMKRHGHEYVNPEVANAKTRLAGMQAKNKDGQWEGVKAKTTMYATAEVGEKIGIATAGAAGITAATLAIVGTGGIAAPLIAGISVAATVVAVGARATGWTVAKAGVAQGNDKARHEEVDNILNRNRGAIPMNTPTPNVNPNNGGSNGGPAVPFQPGMSPIPGRS